MVYTLETPQKHNNTVGYSDTADMGTNDTDLEVDIEKK